jgi:hypothetical protein
MEQVGLFLPDITTSTPFKSQNLALKVSSDLRTLTDASNKQHRHKEHRLISQPTRSQLPKDLDLDLQSLWFTRTPIQLSPRTMKDLGKTNSASSSGWSSSGVRKTHHYITHIRYTDTLASTKIKITWDSSNPSVTVKSEQKHFPPPRELTRSELEQYHEL